MILVSNIMFHVFIDILWCSPWVSVKILCVVIMHGRRYTSSWGKREGAILMILNLLISLQSFCCHHICQISYIISFPLILCFTNILLSFLIATFFLQIPKIDLWPSFSKFLSCVVFDASVEIIEIDDCFNWPNFTKKSNNFNCYVEEQHKIWPQ